MQSDTLRVVTGAFGFRGKYIAKRLLEAGHDVRTLTDSPYRTNPFEGKIKAYPFDFDGEHASFPGLHYFSELARRINRTIAY
jgi:NADH dehydrogenase